uniref:Peptidase S1 domain-containing protein n=1 Tax=Panagrellus redivivus TaxID=6233 RepID=A0A7E4UPW1_PANRE
MYVCLHLVPAMQTFLLALFLVGITVPALGYQCGRKPFTDRIVGGDTAARAAFVALADAVNVTVLSGSHYAEKPAALHNAKNVIIHPEYDNDTFNGDISLIELVAPIKYNKQTQPICLPSVDEGVELTTKTAWATGWGRTKYGGKASNTLQQVKVPFVDLPTCQLPLMKVIPQFRFNRELQICAGQEGKDSCQDSGGPLVIEGDNGKWFQLGITSWGAGCGTTAGLYTRVSGYCDWIASTTDGEVHCQKST